MRPVENVQSKAVTPESVQPHRRDALRAGIGVLAGLAGLSMAADRAEAAVLPEAAKTFRTATPEQFVAHYASQLRDSPRRGVMQMIRGHGQRVLSHGENLIGNGPIDAICAEPAPGKWASNYGPATPMRLLVNGIQPTNGLKGAEELAEFAKLMANTMGGPVMLVINNQEPDLFNSNKSSIVQAVRNSIRGILNPSVGVKVESLTVSRYVKALNWLTDQNRPFEIIAHSQGAIITSNVLSAIDAERSRASARDASRVPDPAALRTLAGITVYGAAPKFPPGYEGILFNHRNDPVSNSTRIAFGVQDTARRAVQPFDRIRAAATHPFSRERREARVQELASRTLTGVSEIIINSEEKGLKPHYMDTYTADLPQFLISCAKERSGRVNGEFLADQTARQIAAGRFTDETLSRVIDLMSGRSRITEREVAAAAQHAGTSFARAFLDRCDSFDSAGATIGKFRISKTQVVALRTAAAHSSRHAPGDSTAR